MDVLVIGGGASGLVSAIISRENNNNVTILEQNEKLGKKLLMTGNGRCNFWNKDQDITKYHSSDLDSFQIIYAKKKDEVLKFFDDLGIIYKNINGYYYPFTLQAQTLVDALVKKIEFLKINVKLQEEVIDIKKENNKFIVITKDNVYYADKVIIATGSLAQSSTKGYDLLKKLGHTIKPIVPSLVPLEGVPSYYKIWQGVRSEVNLKLYEDNMLIKEEKGEIQLTNYGVSGICIFNLSGLVTEGLTKNKTEEIKIDFAPWFKKSKQEFLKYLENRCQENDFYSLRDILEEFLNKKIVNVIYHILKLNNDVAWSMVNQEKLVELIKEFPFKVKKSADFSKAQVCRGGIFLSEINPNTMESRLVKNLFLTGELLDVDGDCGGYNLGFAWMSALIAGENHD